MDNNSRLTRVLIIGFSVLIIGLVLFNTYLFYNQLKDNERDKMSIFGCGYSNIGTDNCRRSGQ